MKGTIILALVFGAVPILAYPIILLAGVMSLAGERSGDEPVLLMTVAYTFLFGSLAYPLVYAPCLTVSLVTLWRPDRRIALGFSLAPLVYLGLLAIVLGLWALVEAASL